MSMIRALFAFPSLPNRLATTLFLLSTHVVLAAELHVAPTGSDTNSGTKSAPFQTFDAARNAAKKVAGREPVTVHVADGTYYLAQTLVFTPADSGTAKCPIIYEAEKEGGAVLSGGQRLELKWKADKNGILKAATPPGLVIDQLFVGGKCQRMARNPNYDASKPTAAHQGFAADAFSKERAAKWSDPTGGYTRLH